MAKLAIIGASGKLGSATLAALLKYKLTAPSNIIALTSSKPSSPTWTKLANQGVEVRHAHFDHPDTMEKALQGVDHVLLISTPHIELDFGCKQDFDGTADPALDDPKHPGRESQHKNAIDAAVRAGVKWIVYASLAFAKTADCQESEAAVMRAHLRTEAYLRTVSAKHEIQFMVLRQGLYTESWPLYLGYFDAEHAGKERDVVALAGDGKVCWTAIHDLGVANAILLAGIREGDENGTVRYLSTRASDALTVEEIADLVGEARGRGLRVQIVGRREHSVYYFERRGVARDAVEWWVSTYKALKMGECEIDDTLLDELLARVGLTATPVKEIVDAMVQV